MRVKYMLLDTDTKNKIEEARYNLNSSVVNHRLAQIEYREKSSFEVKNRVEELLKKREDLAKIYEDLLKKYLDYESPEENKKETENKQVENKTVESIESKAGFDLPQVFEKEKVLSNIEQIEKTGENEINAEIQNELDEIQKDIENEEKALKENVFVNEEISLDDKNIESVVDTVIETKVNEIASDNKLIDQKKIEAIEELLNENVDDTDILDDTREILNIDADNIDDIDIDNINVNEIDEIDINEEIDDVDLDEIDIDKDLEIDIDIEEDITEEIEEVNIEDIEIDIEKEEVKIVSAQEEKIIVEEKPKIEEVIIVEEKNIVEEKANDISDIKLDIEEEITEEEVLINEVKAPKKRKSKKGLFIIILVILAIGALVLLPFSPVNKLIFGNKSIDEDIVIEETKTVEEGSILNEETNDNTAVEAEVVEQTPQETVKEQPIIENKKSYNNEFKVKTEKPLTQNNISSENINTEPQTQPLNDKVDGLYPFRGVNYVISVSTIYWEADAVKTVNEYRANGLNANYYWIPDYHDKNKALYNVFIGPYSSSRVAEKELKNIRKSYPNAFILEVKSR